MSGQAFLPHHEIRVAPGRDPASVDRWVLFLHGIFGSGSNWASFARRLVGDLPAWGALLIDLRMHGDSQGAPPPHTIAACAEDLVRLEKATGIAPRVVSGHSFGSKVALLYAEARRAELAQLWVLDADPGARSDEPGDGADEVLHAIEAIPRRFASREVFRAALMGSGLARPIADWLGTQLRRTEDGDEYRFLLDAGELGDLLADYRAHDLWRFVERPPGGADLHVVLGGRSDVVSAPARRRYEKLRTENPHIFVETLAEAGHWMHIDDPEGLLALFREALDRE